MSEFDVAVGMSEDQLNALSQSLYGKEYPNLFKGTRTIQDSGITYTVDYDVQAPPVFDLMDDAEVQQALQQYVQEQAAGTLTPTDQDIWHQLLSQIPTFKFNFPQVSLVLHNGDNTTTLPLNLTAYCHVTSNGDRANLAPFDIVFVPTGNPLDDVLIRHVFIPPILDMTTKLLQSVQIPPLSFGGVQFSDLALTISDKQLVALANLAAKGVPAIPTDTPWPSAPFFALLSHDTFQAAANSQHYELNHSDRDMKWKFGGEYAYNFVLQNPTITMNGLNLQLSFQLGGAMSAKAFIPFSVGLCYTGSAYPTPSADCTLSVEGGELIVTATKVSDFQVHVDACGSSATKVLSWITKFIEEGVIDTATALITTFMGKVQFTSFPVPSYPVQLGGQQYMIKSQQLQLQPWADYVALTGNLWLSQ